MKLEDEEHDERESRIERRRGLLVRGGGYIGESGVVRERVVYPDTSWRRGRKILKETDSAWASVGQA